MNILFTLFISATITFCVTPLVIRFAIKYGLVDDPRKRYHPANTHIGIVPRAGGVALGIGVFLASCFFLSLSTAIIGILAGAILLMIVGVLDDKKDINPYIRLGTNIIAALTVVYTGSVIRFITNPLTGGILHLDSWLIFIPLGNMIIPFGLPHILAILWIVWTMNIVGWSAGVDGQMPGYVTICAIVLGILSLRYSLVDTSQSWVTIFAFIVAGSFAGFIPWNFFPQHIMPGYGGKTLAGFFLAILGILSYAKLGTAILVLGIPMLDAVATLIRRVSVRHSPVLADRGHLHHRLLDLGWSKQKIALFYWAVSAILGLVSLTVTSRLKVFTFIAVAVTLSMFLVWVGYFTQLSKRRDQDNG
jgi:UDP-GlcNAc:undecaprenyl-phosphate/decaprenyl-phosphate GlcNAc-1-phosphate transferase